jgi:hypothetical protein
MFGLWENTSIKILYRQFLCKDKEGSKEFNQ